ncbi:MAG: SGNH/GDSL hydrolase family protein [Planctomycetota bacterium]
MTATPSTEPRRRSRLRARLLLIAGSALATLLLCEVAARVFDWRQEVRAMAAWQQLGEQKLKPPTDADTNLAHTIRLSPHPRIVYELIPNLEFRYFGARCRTNSHGFRSPEIPVQKPPGAFRVVVLGDSVAFGHGVEQDEVFAHQLGLLLRERHPGRAIDVINTGVSGYNTAMEVETLVQKGLAFGPDLVVYHFVGNDLDLPNLIWTPQDFTRLDRSFLWDKMARAFGDRDPWREKPWGLAPEENGRFVYREGEVAPQYRDMVGIDMFEREIGRLLALGREHGFAVLVTSHGAPPLAIGAALRRAGAPIEPAWERVDAWLRERAAPRFAGSELAISATDPHPRAIVHRWLAEQLAARIERDGMLR